MTNNALMIVTCGILTCLLLLSIMFAGPHLLLPATFMIIVILVGGYCVFIAKAMLTRRAEIMEDWQD